MPKLSIIIVTYNSAEVIERCLESLLLSASHPPLDPSDVEIIVVDNASQDATREIIQSRFPQVRLLSNPHNVGYGSANNQGLALAQGEYALILNPDTWAEKSALSLLVSFMDDHPEALACGGRLLFPDGKLQNSASNALTLWAVFCEQTLLEKIFPHSRFLSPYWVSHHHLRKHPHNPPPLKTFQVMGACMMLRRLHGEFPRFDERFFLYCEDTDLCKRLNEKAQRGNPRSGIFYVPFALFYHSLGHSSEKERARSVSYYNRGKELYFFLHYGRLAMALCFLMNRMGALFRLLVWFSLCLFTLFLLPRWRAKVLLFLKVLGAPLNPYPKIPKTDILTPRA
jgi:N-acetylglucosaminyl-diphospho-decaprenol L-rhamnosyltransferase